MTKARSNATAPAAKGEIVVGTGSDVSGILSVGNSGDTLVADSSTTTGLRWQEPKAQQCVINSAFQVWQRGTSFTATNFLYTADRWQVYTGAATTSTVSRQTTSDTTNLPNIQYAIRYQRNSGQTGTAMQFLAQSLESVDSIPFAGKTVTLSFYARRGANYSATSNILIAYLRSGTGTDQNIFTGFTGQLDLIANGNTTLTTTWQRFSYTATVPTNATQLGIQWTFTPTGTAGANDWFEITGVQLEAGSVATPFRTYSATLAGELAACQRYYYRIGGDLYSNFGQGYATSTTNFRFMVQAPVTMRVKPTALDSSAANTFNPIDAANTSYTPTSITFNSTESDARTQAYDAGGSGFTAARYAYNRAGNTTAAFIGFSAEL